MNYAISDTQKASYRKNGFVALPTFLNAEEVESWRSVVATATSRDTNMPGKDVPMYGDREADYKKIFKQLINLHLSSPQVRDLVIDQRIGDIICALEDVSGVRLYQDQALFKEPWGTPTPLHQDIPAWPFTNTSSATIWVALDDATTENGCLCYLAGSHRSERLAHASFVGAIDDGIKPFDDWRKLECVHVPLPAGGAVVHKGLTVHGAGANMTPRTRRSISFAYMPEGATFNGKIAFSMPDALKQNLNIGDVLADDTNYPLIKRSVPSEMASSSTR